jgi:hypothetical protein
LAAITPEGAFKDSKEGRTSFLKKRSKKLLQIWLPALAVRGVQQIKVFCFFFSKKKTFLTRTTPAPPLPQRW